MEKFPPKMWPLSSMGGWKGLSGQATKKRTPFFVATLKISSYLYKSCLVHVMFVQSGNRNFQVCSILSSLTTNAPNQPQSIMK